MKPDNVLLTADMTVKLADFGLSEIIDASPSLRVKSQLSTARSPNAKGTLAFMAPEIYSRTFSEGADVYAFGMVAYCVLTGHYPFADVLSPTLIEAQVKEGKRPSLASVPKEYYPLLTVCWLQDRKQRWSMSRILAFLRGQQVSNSDAMRWTVVQVKAWLIENDFEEFVPAFERAKITGVQLAAMDFAYMESALDITKKTHRESIYFAIQALFYPSTGDVTPVAAEKWSAGQVSTWMIERGFIAFAPLFKESFVTGLVLKQLNNQACSHSLTE